MFSGFCSKFHMLSCSAKNYFKLLRFDRVTESLKVRTFLRPRVDIICIIVVAAEPIDIDLAHIIQCVGSVSLLRFT